MESFCLALMNHMRDCRMRGLIPSLCSWRLPCVNRPLQYFVLEHTKYIKQFDQHHHSLTWIHTNWQTSTLNLLESTLSEDNLQTAYTYLRLLLAQTNTNSTWTRIKHAFEFQRVHSKRQSNTENLQREVVKTHHQKIVPCNFWMPWPPASVVLLPAAGVVGGGGDSSSTTGKGLKEGEGEERS